MCAVQLSPRYEYVRELGQGGAGRVFLVRDGYLDKDVALKLLHDRALLKEEIDQVQREFALLSELHHPSIARAHDFGYFGNRPYFTSEFVPGERLGDAALDRNGDRLLPLAGSLAEALAFLHRGGILHLDVKTSNVIVSDHADTAVLIDFGLFRRGITTKPGRVVKGSLPYMAPEYFRGDSLGPWTDVYAYGVTLYRVLTGRFPRAHAKSAGDWETDWDPAPPAPSQLDRASRVDLDGIVLGCLALDPRSRFQQGDDILDALQRMGVRTARTVEAAGARSTVGRDGELQRLDALLRGFTTNEDSASQRPNQVGALVTGSAGMGQSQLLREVKVRAQTLGRRCYLEVGYPGRAESPGSLLRCLRRDR